MTSAEYIAGKLAILFIFLISVTFLPAMMLLLTQAVFAGSLDLRSQQPLPAAGHHAVLARPGDAGLDDDAGAVVAVEEQPLRGGDVRGPVLLYRRALPGASRHHRQQPFAWLSPTASLEQLGDVIFRLQPRYQMSRHRRPWPVAVVVLIAGSIWILMRRVRGVEIVT